MRISTGEGNYQVWLEQHNIGSDILFILGGGENTHIGGIVVGEPNKAPEIIRLGNHYDHYILTPIIETAQKHYDSTIVAIGGIHIDNASKTDINILIQNCKKLTKRIGEI
jgi:hypothetical protein